MIGDTLRDRYIIADKLGFGGYSTVWLARDTHQNRYVALIINTANASSHEAQLFKTISNSTACQQPFQDAIAYLPRLLDEFVLEGPNGKHSCYTVSPARSNLKEASYSRLFSLGVSHALAYELVLAVACLHCQGVVHEGTPSTVVANEPTAVHDSVQHSNFSELDIPLQSFFVKLPAHFDSLSTEELYADYGKPETVPVTRRDGEALSANCPAKAVAPLFLGKYVADFRLIHAQITLSDFGEAFSPATEPRLGKDCHMPFPYRAPEAKFEPEKPLSSASDIWSLATALWEIIGMKALFSTECVTEDETTAQHIDVLGLMPGDWLNSWQERAKFFDDLGSPTES